MRAVLGIIITLGFFGVVFGVLSGFLAAGDSTGILLGVCATGWGAIVSYYFGSSVEKTPTIEPVKCE